MAWSNSNEFNFVYTTLINGSQSVSVVRWLAWLASSLCVCVCVPGLGNQRPAHQLFIFPFEMVNKEVPRETWGNWTLVTHVLPWPCVVRIGFHLPHAQGLTVQSWALECRKAVIRQNYELPMEAANHSTSLLSHPYTLISDFISYLLFHFM